MDECEMMDEWCEWINGCECMDVKGWMDGCERIDGWMDGCEWMNAWMDVNG